MQGPRLDQVPIVDCHPPVSSFRSEVLDGLARVPRSLPCKYFYDQLGAALFERICELDEYYLTRTEFAILQSHVDGMAAALGRGCRLVELGSGTSVKTRMLLERIVEPAAYIPVDIARGPLLLAAATLARVYPHVKVMPVCADYTRLLGVLPEVPGTRTAVYFPGSTIGNFTPAEASRFLAEVKTVCGVDGCLLFGADLKKDQGMLHRAYNDAAGVTAAFNLNLLTRINRELGGNFDLRGFRHRAFYDDGPGRIEMQLVSRRQQTVRIGRDEFEFASDEPITTEYSHKYSLRELADLTAAVGFATKQVWTDPQQGFAVLYCEAR